MLLLYPHIDRLARIDKDDLIYKTKREKYNAVVNEIEQCHRKGQPSLVGTISVEASELLSRMLKEKVFRIMS